MAPAIYTPRCNERRAILSRRISCALAVTGWLRASAIAGAAGIPMSTHLYPEVAAHVMRVTETAHWLEWQDWVDPVLQRPYEIRDGCFTFLMRLALALNGMRKRSQPIKSTCRLISCSKVTGSDRLRVLIRGVRLLRASKPELGSSQHR
jgi:hypothetical protein